MSNPTPARNETTRRTFIKGALSAGAAFAAAGPLGCAQTGTTPQVEPTPAPAEPGQPKPVVHQPKSATPYNQINVAFIGTGGIGKMHLEHAAELGFGCQCFCDVDTAQHATAAEMYPHARRYQDYREMFDKEAKNIDAVMIGTPDHHHYPATIIAMQLGKHVYTQKPLTHTPWEARQLTEAAKKYKVVTQMGNQGHAMEGWRLVYEWIRSGALGQIREVHTWTDRPIWPQGMERPEGSDPIPSTLNWDIWLGPAPERPFKKDVYHRFAWRGWWDFGAGALGDMACHTMDGVFWALDPGYPTSVEPIAATPITADAFPKSAVIKWEYPAKGDRAAFVSYWYDGGLMPPFPPELEIGRKMSPTGNLFLGTKASMLVQGDYGDSPRIIPEAKMKEIGKPAQLLERSPGQIQEWIMAVAGEKPQDFTKSNFGYAGPFTESILLGNIALRVGRRLEWDGANMKFTNVPEANQFVSKEYRSGWKF
ncbi:MAG: Gfo/Idh/MocA family oxidoreductase [Phycisphaerae bacterium]|nr:Gfo/Idh/MocA family oxidoreductase [Phycisphaerae bacterium]